LSAVQLCGRLASRADCGSTADILRLVRAIRRAGLWLKAPKSSNPLEILHLQAIVQQLCAIWTFRQNPLLCCSNLLNL
jgi:hypothetical protein